MIMKTFVKVLIWISVVIADLVASLIFEIICIAAFSLRPGYLFDLAFMAAFGLLGKKLCERWELHCRGIDVAVIDGKATIDGKSRREYLVEHTPKFIIDYCADRHTTECLEELLKPYVKSGAITKKMAKALAEEFGDNPYNEEVEKKKTVNNDPYLNDPSIRVNWRD